MSSHKQDAVLGLITARGKSKGIPGKNLFPCAGKPLIAWTIEASRNAAAIDRVLVSTDDPEIAETARELGAECPFLRPAELATDSAGTAGVTLHALEWLESTDGFIPEYIMILQPTSPLRMAADIDGAVELARIKNADAVISITEPLVNPFLTAYLRGDGTLDYLFDQSKSALPRQENPGDCFINGAIYLVRRDAFLEHRKFLLPKTFPFFMPQERSIDIDTPYHMEICDLLLKQKLYGN